LKIILKVSKKGAKGFQISSVPVKKLKSASFLDVRSWSLEGDFIVLTATV
jgi:hypothetical protein